MFDFKSLKDVEILKETDRQKIILAADDKGKKYIRREISEDRTEIYKNIQKIYHPNIPEVFFVRFDDKTVVIEEYIDGVSLDKLIENGVKLTKKQIKKYFSQMLSALEKLHSINIIHRDIKPENCIIDSEDRLWLTDFDISRIYRKDLRKDTEIKGTFGYAPIEQFGMMPTDFKTDIYALGVTLGVLLEYAGIKGKLYKIAEKCKRLDPSLRFNSIRKIKNSITLNRVANIALLSVAIVSLCMSIALFYNEKITESDVNSSYANCDVTDEQLKQEKESEESIYLEEDELSYKEPTIIEENTNDYSDENNNSDSLDYEENNESEVYNFDGNFDGFNRIGIENDINSYDSGVFSVSYPCEYLAFLEDGNKSGRIKLNDDSVVKGNISLSNGCLNVQLQDNYGNILDEKFQYNPHSSYKRKYNNNLRRNAEIICHDFDEDGRNELLIGLNECSVNVVNGQLNLGINYCVAWCVKYDADSGFVLCDNYAFSDASHFLINSGSGQLNLLWDGSSGPMGYYLENNTIKQF